MARAQKTNADMITRKPPLNLPVADHAPTAGDLTDYDQEHLITYLRLLDADAEGADGRDVARIMLRIDPEREPDRAVQRRSVAGLVSESLTRVNCPVDAVVISTSRKGDRPG